MISAPFAYVTSHPSGASARSPSSTVAIASRGWPVLSQWAWPELPAQSPSWVSGSSALGPTTAIFRTALSSGSSAVVAQQHERAARGLEVERRGVGLRDHGALALDVGQAGVLEEAQVELEGEDAADGLIDERLVQEALRDGLLAPSKNLGVVMIMSFPALTAAAAAWA